ncbi:hypothetical protein EVAR_49178_1 [Eumeta japonica]|uniref:Uncharacterized protein n=1 Tax=Eumeta variegata TaxID=151549 RepID=A0A4C1YJL5_EUMVA|nr:hypothetical protein EVAR_49178_1 [Eumeta japonica]
MPPHRPPAADPRVAAGKKLRINYETFTPTYIRHTEVDAALRLSLITSLFFTTLWSIWLEHENGGARSTRYCTLAEYGRKLKALVVRFVQ